MPSTARDLMLEHFRWIGGHADVWAIFRDAKALAAVVAALVAPFRDEQITAVCGIESRGFLLGGASAVELGVGFVPIRKGEGLFPGDKVVRQSSADYRRLRHTLRLQRSSLGPQTVCCLLMTGLRPVARLRPPRAWSRSAGPPGWDAVSSLISSPVRRRTPSALFEGY